MDTKHKNSLSCDVCDKMFPNLNTLEEHKSKDQNLIEISSKTQIADREESFNEEVLADLDR